jgi:hypothetical protein
MHRCEPWFAPFIPMIFLAGTTGASPVAATIDATRNPTETPQTLRLDIRGAMLSGKGTLRCMALQSLTANVVVGQEPGVRIDEQSLTALPANPTFAPYSFNIYEFPVK